MLYPAHKHEFLSLWRERATTGSQPFLILALTSSIELGRETKMVSQGVCILVANTNLISFPRIKMITSSGLLLNSYKQQNSLQQKSPFPI